MKAIIFVCFVSVVLIFGAIFHQNVLDTGDLQDYAKSPYVHVVMVSSLVLVVSFFVAAFLAVREFVKGNFDGGIRYVSVCLIALIAYYVAIRIDPQTLIYMT